MAKDDKPGKDAAGQPDLPYVGQITKYFEKSAPKDIRKAIEKGFAPLTVGLILASAWIMSKAADHDWRAYLLTGVCTVIFSATKINPLIIVAAAGLIGWLGWV